MSARCYTVSFHNDAAGQRKWKHVTIFANTRRSAVQHARLGVGPDWSIASVRPATPEERAAKEATQ